MLKKSNDKQNGYSPRNYSKRLQIILLIFLFFGNYEKQVDQGLYQ